ncbi:unnamed protein product [Effrenium voratum]|uniref:Uncharacterized protein n=1 Tax=Effrenium voratum TaxID=2562239 RepID=A0AA36MTC9_9DINO|nr:unnamed protein product [Effrenium voratum]CAJ1417583.1 unnamed protein product [Effrenium voratum]
MGASHAVELIAEHASQSQPGMQSIISGPLDELDPPVTPEEAFEECLALLKYPLDSASESLLKELSLKETDDCNFTLKVILDGKKLDGYGYGKGDGTDRVRNWKKVSADRSKLRITCVDYVDEGKMGAWVTDAKEEPITQCVVNMLKDPGQIEFCLDRKGQRRADPKFRDGLYAWSDAIIGSVQAQKRAKVKVQPDAPSIQEKGLKSMVSEPMDEHVSYDNFFPQLVKAVKTLISGVPKISVEEVSDEELRGTAVDEKGETTTHAVKFSQSAGTLCWTITAGDKVMSQMHRVVHRDPLVMEAWDIGPDGARSCGISKAKQMQKNINDAIEKANSWFG